MNTEWSLDLMYKSYDDPAFLADLDRIDTLINEFHALSSKLPSMEETDALNAIFDINERYSLLVNKVFTYVMLRQTTNTTDPDTTALMGKLSLKTTEISKDSVIFDKYVANAKNLDSYIANTEKGKTYEHNIRRTVDLSKHLLADDVEEMFEKMNLTGGNAWSNLFDYLTSTVKVDYNGEVINLPAVRNLAYSADASVRKAAYEAEIACYEKIKDPVAFCLNNIKKQVNMIAETRGYESPLAMTLTQCDMKQETLDSLWTAIREYLPKFHAYLRRKGELLGHKNGLPWYDMFAPLGESSKTFTIEEAGEYLVSIFSKFSQDMADMMSDAFKNRWIDFEPHDGKVGGAFCDNLTWAKQSRILTNFDGSLSAVDTLAHELGHAYHGMHIEDHAPLNWGYSMPVAETASTFNENVFMSTAIEEASKEEKIALIDGLLQEQTQTICDIYSRFLFEDAVFNRTKDEFLFADQLKEIMLDAQQQAYGDGLDPDCKHPFMWTCKGHYYSEGLSYYNFPYAFGALFAKGLYAMYKEEGASFVPKYQALLKATTVSSVEDVAMMVGADLTKPDFWRNSLKLIAEQIDEFLELTK